MPLAGEDQLIDAINMHIHPLVNGEFSPELAFETVGMMKEAGMAAVLLKPNFDETTLVAGLIDDFVSNFRTLGELIMERSAGGINPYVVKNQIALGAKKIWIPLMTQNFWGETEVSSEEIP